MAGLKNCDQENCTVRKDGKCLEGIEDISQCSHFYLEPDEDEEDESEEEGSDNDSPSSNAFRLFKGEELALDQLTEVTYRFPTKQVYILGEHDSGKTTILATLFEMFQAAPFHDFHFAGSLTQIGFERRCFHSRLASANGEADTERTKTEEFRFLHIALKKQPDEKQATHFLISDISGEKIKRAKNNSEDMRDLAVIEHSVHVSFVIDGEKLVDVKKRQAALTQARTFVRKAIDEKIFNKSTKLAIIISKWDLLEGLDGFDYRSLIELSFQRDFQDSLGELQFLKIAVRPTKFDVFKLGHETNSAT